MNLLASGPKIGSPPTLAAWMPKATHGLMLLLGIAVWHALPHQNPPDDSPPTGPRRNLSRQTPDTRANAWIDATLAKLHQTKREEVGKNKRPATMEEFLRNVREEFETNWKEEQEKVDNIIKQARKMGPIQNPSAALFASQRDKKATDELIIFQRWLDSDSEAALSEMESNWSLQEESYLPSLLMRKFGIDWVKSTMADAATPFRLRRALAEELAQQAAHGNGLDQFLEFYQTTPDPELKSQMAWRFSNEWPLDQPKAAADFLSEGIPKELRRILLQSWSQMPSYLENSWEETWMKELHQHLGMAPYDAANHRVGMCNLGGQMDPAFMTRWDARQSMSYEEIIQDCLKQGYIPQKAAEEAIHIKLNQALEKQPNLIESFSEGQLSRSALLEELRRAIPVSASDSDRFEQNLWQRIAWKADPHEVARWAAELSQRGNIDDLLTSTFSSGRNDDEPRMPTRLQRYFIITKDLPDESTRQSILRSASWEWSRWYQASPLTAIAWRDGLPENDPMRIEILEKQAEENRIREKP